MADPVLVVQMGHVGRTSGATGAPGEQVFAAAVGQACAELLHGHGWLIHPIAADPPAAYYQGQAFVAVHADGSTNPTVRGASVGYQNTAGGQLAQAWRDAYAARGFTGPWHPDNYTANLAQYYGVRAALSAGNTRACIVECGTITNAEDRALMDPRRVALAIGDAVGIPHGLGGPATPETYTEEEEAMLAFITCLSPNQSAVLLSGGRVIDITSDAEARKSAQTELIDTEKAVEWHVSNATFRKLVGGEV